MDKGILKKFAIESRQDLMNKISNKIKTFYVKEEFKKEQKGEVYLLSNEKHSLSLTKEENDKRDLLIKRIKELTLEQVIEEAAYTWFNRIIAIRYMEINDMLPLTKNNSSLGIRVLSSKDNTPDPEILKFTNLTNPDLDIDFKKEKYIELKDNNEKFKYILLLICKKLGKVIPHVFGGNTDYIDILIPDNLLNDAGFITKIINDVPEENYNQVEIIGWLYQYYISEKKDEAFKNLKNKIKLDKNSIPAATQLFTPDWIVKYMVENTLGKLWINSKSNNNLIKELEYYIDNNDTQNNIVSPERIKVIDPCSGSGHILLYMFELLYKIYDSVGYKKNEIPQKILRNNLFGLDIDDRAGQLSMLTVLLKAREFDKGIFNKNIDINIFSIQESNSLERNALDLLIDGESQEFKEMVNYIYDTFKDAKEYGSIVKIDYNDYDLIFEKINNLKKRELNIFEYQNLFEIENKFVPLIQQAKLLSQKYNVVVTNPPYMGNKGMNTKLLNYTKQHYDDYKFDMFSVFIKRASDLTEDGYYYSLVTQPSILFLSSFEHLRNDILSNETINSVLHMGRGIFGVDFGSTAFVIQKEKCFNFYGKYFKLYDRTFQYIDCDDIKNIFLSTIKDNDFTFNFSNYVYSNNELEISSNEEDSEEVNNENIKILYTKNQDLFKDIPTQPFTYWLSDKMIELFKRIKVGDKYIAKQGIITADTNRFLRRWTEVDFKKIGWRCNNKVEAQNSKKKWFPYNKGGNYRKWYGNNEYLINWYNDGQELREFTNTLPQGSTARLKSQEYYFKESITWSLISSKYFGARYSNKGFLFDVGGSSIFENENKYAIEYLLAYLSTNIASQILKVLNPTMNCPIKDVKALPLIYDKNFEKEIIDLVKENIKISKEDWDSFETSWDFKKCPILNINNEENISLNQVFNNWKNVCNERFNIIKNNEEKINYIFNKIYDLENEVTNKIMEDSIVIRKADRVREIKSLISYAVGCMFGRYSLDEDGLIYAGGEFDSSKYKTFDVDVDNIIPITDEAYFNDDIVIRFRKFIEVVYGKETLNENLDYIAETLGKRGTETSEDTIRRYFVNDFYNDHIKTYQKRPIYWLFDSGKKNGFKCLIYMHRYSKDLVATIRTKYIPKVQTTYEKLLSDVEYKLSTDLSLADKKEMEKKKIELNGKIQEVKEYYEMIANVANKMIDIDLDDGVVVNYSKFTYLNPKTNKEESILGKIK